MNLPYSVVYYRGVDLHHVIGPDMPTSFLGYNSFKSERDANGMCNALNDAYALGIKDAKYHIRKTLGIES